MKHVMTLEDVLDVLRNPCHWDEDTIGKAMLEACRVIEEQQDRINNAMVSLMAYKALDVEE